LIPSGGGGNTPPTVSISSPADGASFNSGESISFSGSASDTEDGDLTAGLVWTSNLDGQIGIDGSFSAVLNDGTHTITASVTDSEGLVGSDSITIVVQPESSGTVTVASLTGSSYLINKNFWKATVVVTIDPALSGATVSGTWDTGSGFSCTTDGAGQCSGTLNARTSVSSVTLTVNNVVLTGYEYVPTVTSVIVYKP
jgi:hypothetical protein